MFKKIDKIDNILCICVQVAEPLRAMVVGAPLEDARHLAQRYDRMRQEAEAQVKIDMIILCCMYPLLPA